MLRAGAPSWNAWRKENPKARPFFNFWDFKALGIDFSDMNLRHVSFFNAELSGVNLSGADISYADFRYAKLLHADMRYVVADYPTFWLADLTYADMSHAKLLNCNLEDALIHKLRLVNAEMTNSARQLAKQRGAIIEE